MPTRLILIRTSVTRSLILIFKIYDQLYYIYFIFRLCERYDKMADRVNETPKTTQELVEIQEYMKTVINLFQL